jgi:hypothetical protein
MESKIIEIASGSLSAMHALACLLAEFGEASLVHTLMPAIEKKQLKGKALGTLFYHACEADALKLGQRLCPLLSIRPTCEPESPPTPALPKIEG